MPTRKQINPDEKVGLILSVAERKTILDEIMCLEWECKKVIRTTPTAKPIMLTIDQWDDLGGCIAAEANHTEDNKLHRKLNAIFSDIKCLLSSHSSEEPSSKLKIFRPQEE